jgi:hypothetical protein
MLLRSSSARGTSALMRAAQLEELRHQEARRALERCCRILSRRFDSLESDHRALRGDHDAQRERVDSLAVRFDAVLAMVSALVKGGPLGASVESDGSATESDDDDDAHCTHEAEEMLVVESLRNEKAALEKERARLLRRNAELELQVSTVMAQFGRLVADYESVRATHDQLKAAVATASSVEELAEWVSI